MKVEILITNPNELRLFNDFASMLFTMRGANDQPERARQQEPDLEVKEVVAEAKAAVEAEEAIEKAAKPRAKAKKDEHVPVEAADEPPTVATRDDAKKILMKVSKEKGHDAAAELLAKFGAKKMGEVSDDDLAALVEAGKALV